MDYTSIFIYKLKPEFLRNVIDNFPLVRVFNDELLCDATYLFVPEDISKEGMNKLRACLGGSYHEVSTLLISEPEVDKMFNKKVSEKDTILVGNLGYLNGFGSVQMCVVSVEGGSIVVKPTSVNMFKPILALTEDFKLEKNPLDKLEYTYNTTIAIDCDIFPNSLEAEDGNLYYFLLKETLARVLYNVYSMVDNVSVVLLRPCPMLQMVGASLGVYSCSSLSGKEHLLSDQVKSTIRINPLKNYSIINISDMSRGETIQESIDVRSLVELHSSLELHSNLNAYEIYQLLNRRYFIYHNLLDINLKTSPLGDE